MKNSLAAIGKATAILSAALVLGLPQPGWAANRGTTQNGDWANNATWGGSQYPTNGDTAYINKSVTLTNNEQIALGAGNIYLGSNTTGVIAPGSLIVSNSGTALGFTRLYSDVANAGGNTIKVRGGAGVTGLITLGATASGGGNNLTIDSGGTVSNSAALANSVGDAGGANTALVTGANSRWVVGANVFNIGNTSSGNRLTVSDGGYVQNGGQVYIGYAAGANSNEVLVTDATSKLQVTNSAFYMGRDGSFNSLVVSNNGQVVLVAGGSSHPYVGNSGSNNSLTVIAGGVFSNAAAVVMDIGLNAGAVSNAVLVSGSNSVLYTANNLDVGTSGSGNSLTITNGGYVYSSTAYLGYRGNNHSARVTGRGSRLDFGNYGIVGSLCTNSSLTIADGGVVFGVNNDAKIGELAGSFSNSVLVTDPMSRWTVRDIYVGQGGDNNRLTITNGGQVAVTAALSSYIGAGANTANGNRVVVTGPGSSWGLYSLNIGAISTAATTNMCNNSLWVDQGGAVTGSSALAVGTTTNSNNNGVLLTKGGLMEFTGITVGHLFSAGNYVTNAGGILQFTAATPTITVNNSPQNTIVITNGTVSFRNVTLVNLTNNWVNSGIGTSTVVWQGANTLRLDNSIGTNTLASGYTFNDNLGPTNYAGLELVNGTTAINGNKAVMIGANGSLLFSNTTATLWGAVTNYGRMAFHNSIVTFTNGLVLNGGANAQLIWTSNSTISVNGDLTLPSSMVFSNALGMGLSDNWPVLTVSGTIGNPGAVANWTVYPNSHRLVVSGNNSLRIVPRNPGFLFGVK